MHQTLIRILESKLKLNYDNIKQIIYKSSSVKAGGKRPHGLSRGQYEGDPCCTQIMLGIKQTKLGKHKMSKRNFLRDSRAS